MMSSSTVANAEITNVRIGRKTDEVYMNALKADTPKAASANAT